jgi:peptidoglycan/LPS O-acetylase OafA/YrhL
MTVQQPHLSHSKYRPDIDGLRAVAVLAVVAFHAFPNWVRGGFIGVDVFFVISGYLISIIIFESLDRGTFSFNEFYSRRIRRIFPALILVLIACFAFGWFALLADEYKQLGKHIAAGAGFISNFTLWNEAGYFDNSAETKPLLHLWSLGIEEQFYIVWPLLLWFAWKRKFNLLTITIVVAIASFVLNIKGIKHDLVATFYSPQTRFWELLSGSLLAWVTLYKKDTFANFKLKIDDLVSRIVYSEKQDNDGNTLDNVISFFGLFLLLYGFWGINKELSFPGRWALVPVLGAVLIITAGSKAWVNRKILSNKIAVWFGLISFPLYLWHWPLLSFARIVGGEVPSRNLRIATVVLSIVLSWLTYKLIERPLRFGKYGKVKVTVLVFLMTIVGFIGYNTSEHNGLLFRTIAKQAKDFEYKSDINGYVACNIEELKGNNITLNYCLLSDSKIPNSVIIGDSHSEDKFHGLVAMDKKNNWMLIGNSSCPPVLGISVEGDQKGCEDKFKAILEYLVKNKNIENIVFSFYGNYFKSDAYAADHIKNNVGPNAVKISSSIYTGNKSDLFYDGLNSAIKKLTEGGKSVTLFIDVPELPFFPKDCFRNSFKQCEIPMAEVIARQGELRNIVSKLKNSNPSLKIFDPINLLCSSEKCGYKRDGVIIYRDSHHLTLRGSNLFAEQYISTR